MNNRLSKLFIGLGFISLLLTGCQSGSSSGKEVIGYHVDENGHLIIEYNDGSTKDMGEYNPGTKFLVSFLNYDSSVLYTTSVEKGGTAVYQGETPIRPKSDNYVYLFNGWSDSLENVVSNMTVVAQYEMLDRYYTVTFNNYDDSLLGTQKVEYGQTAFYSGTPTRPSTNTTNYVFNGWDISLENVKSNFTATAQYTESTRYYTVTFRNYDGAYLGTGQVEYDGTVSYSFDEPVKPGDVQYASYIWTGWDESLDHITENCTRTATFEHGPLQQYTVTYRNYDNTSTLYTDIVEYGGHSTYKGSTPLKPSTAQYSYTFSNSWDTSGKSLYFISSNVTAVPIFSSSLNSYTVKFYNDNGDLLDESTVEYGSSATYSGAVPTKESEEENMYYAFAGWDTDFSNVTGDLDVTATFSSHTKFKDLALGDNHVLLKGTDNYIYSFGDNSCGQLGSGTTTDSNIPIKVANNLHSSSSTKLFAGGNTSGYYGGSNSLYMWGSSRYGQCGNDTYNTNVMIPTKLNALSADRSFLPLMAIGGNHVLSTTYQSQSPVYYFLLGWGKGSDGQLKADVNTWVTSPKYLSYSNKDYNYKDIQAAGDNSAVLNRSGKLHLFGNNDYGQIGNGTTTKSTGYDVNGTFNSFSLASDYIAAVSSTGDLYTWGNNNKGQLGTGDSSNRYSPTKINLDFEISNVKCAQSFTILKSTSGKYYISGYNPSYAFGDSKTYSTFTEVTTDLSNVAIIDANSKGVFVITNDNKLGKLSNGVINYI